MPLNKETNQPTNQQIKSMGIKNLEVKKQIYYYMQKYTE